MATHAIAQATPNSQVLFIAHNPDQKQGAQTADKSRNSQVLFIAHNPGQKQAAQTAHKFRLISSLWRNLQGLGIWFSALSAGRNEFASKIDSCIYSTLDKSFN